MHFAAIDLPMTAAFPVVALACSIERDLHPRRVAVRAIFSEQGKGLEKHRLVGATASTMHFFQVIVSSRLLNHHARQCHVARPRTRATDGCRERIFGPVRAVNGERK